MNAPFLIERDHASLTIAWIKVDNADCYELEMMIDGGEWNSLSSSLKGSSIRKKNLMEGLGYTFRIRVKHVDTNEWSPFSCSSDPFYVLSGDVKLMEPPEIVSKDDVSMTLQWKEVTGAEGYMLRYHSDESATYDRDTYWAKIDSIIKNTTVRKKGLKSGANYQFAILPVGFSDETNDIAPQWSYSLSSVPTKVLIMPPFMQKLFPSTLIGGTSKTATPTASLLSGKCVAIYFSAHWCGPCRQFTPKLLELYTQCKAANKRFEIVFCSADHSEEEFKQYHASMKWPAIGYEEEHREGMMGMFKVSGIPRLCVLAASGRIINDNAISSGALTLATVDQWIQASDNMK